MNYNWIYFGIFLDESSKDKLVNLSKEVVDPSWKLFCHHMTIAFNDGSVSATQMFEYYNDTFGERFELQATHIGISDDAVAVKVEFPYPINNKIPHITLATPQGGKPVNSNYITEWKKLDTPIQLTGILNVFKKK